MFLDGIEKIARITKAIIKQKNVKIFVQHDADGLCSASILTKMLLRENVNFELRVFKQLTSDVISKLEINEDDFIIFADFGSGQLPLLKYIIEKAHVLILDHHEPTEFSHMNLFYLNPLLFGEEETSSSIVCYLFAKFLNIKNVDLVDIAIIGAVADEAEEKWEFKGMIKKILDEAETIGKISVSKGLRLYGRFTRPIHQSLAYSFDPFIPGISGSESQAVQFLSELGIKIKDKDEWIKLKDLTVEEQQKLASAIVIERLKTEEDAIDIFGDIYTLIGRPEELQDAREFATLVNACGRIGYPEIGIRLLLGDYNVLEKSWDILDNYRKLISESLNWIRENKEAILSDNFATFLLAENKIPETLIGTITSIVLNSNFVDVNKPIFGLAYTEDGRVKISVRATKNVKIDLGDIMRKITATLAGEGGGHFSASGGLIPKEKIQEFIKSVNMLFGELVGCKEN